MSAEEDTITFTTEELSLENAAHFTQEFIGPMSLFVPDAFNDLVKKIAGIAQLPDYVLVKLNTGGSVNSFYFRLRGEENYPITIESNHFSGELSPDALGITATLYLMNTMLWSGQMPERTSRYLHNGFYMLRDYAAQHPEAAAIYGAID